MMRHAAGYEMFKRSFVAIAVFTRHARTHTRARARAHTHTHTHTCSYLLKAEHFTARHRDTEYMEEYHTKKKSSNRGMKRNTKHSGIDRTISNKKKQQNSVILIQSNNGI